MKHRTLYIVLVVIAVAAAVWLTWPEGHAELVVTDFSQTRELFVRAPWMPFRSGACYVVVEGDLDEACAMRIYSGRRRIPEYISLHGSGVRFQWGGPEYWIDAVRIVLDTEAEATGELRIKLYCGKSPLALSQEPNRGAHVVKSIFVPKSEDLSGLDVLAVALTSAKEVFVREGLPHQSWERELLNAELMKETSEEIRYFHFYKTAVPLVKAHRAAVEGVLLDRERYEVFDEIVIKECGGFHPDYGLAFTYAGDPYFVQLCFGCDELRAYGPNYSVYYDVKDGATTELEEVFLAYKNQRPRGIQR